MSREEFAKDLRMMCKKYNIKQKELAEVLLLSCAAVSQFMTGASLPKPEQLVKMMEKMGTTAQESQSMLFRLMLARTGINETHTDPGPETESTWPFNMNHFFPPNALNTPENLFKDPASGTSVPVLYLEDMDDFTAGAVLNNYAQSRSRRGIIRDFGIFDDAVIIETCGEKISLPYCGLVQLTVAGKLPENYTSLMLCRLNDNSYRIIPECDNMRWQLFSLGKTPAKESIVWQLPLLEMSFTPLCRVTENGLTERL